MSKKALITGTLILTSASLITKCIGFFYRVYMVNLIGTEGMGLYQLIMPIYMLTWSITSSGFTTTISKLTAQEKAKNQTGNMGRILKQSLFMTLTVSMLLSGFLFFCADWFALNILKEPRTALSFRILAIAIPFMSSGSCIRGYFFGLQNALVPAFSQVIEQIIRIIAIYFTASLLVPLGLSYACVCAVIGIVLGEIISFLFVFCNYLHFKRKKKYIKKPTLSSFKTLHMICAMALPLTASRMVSSLLSTIENILIPQRLQLFGQSSADAISTYGELTGMAMPLIMLPSAFLTSVSVSLVPEISQASAVKQNSKIASTVSATLLFSSILSIGAGIVFAVFPKEVCYIVYGHSDLGGLLFLLAFICPFLYMQMTLNGLLNGLGEHIFLFQSNILSSIITIGFIYFLIPVYGIFAYLGGWFFSLLITMGLSLYKIVHCTQIHIPLGSCFFKPLLAGLASGLTIRYVIQIGSPSKAFFLFCICSMMALYFLCLFALGCFKKETSMLLLYRKKAAK